MPITGLDHLVITIRDLDATIRFYTEVLGMTEITFGNERKALAFGNQKINLHVAGHEFVPKASRPTPGSADLCFLTDIPITEIAEQLRALDIPIEQGPVPRTGATGPITSIYLRDPDGNLIELATPGNPIP